MRVLTMACAAWLGCSQSARAVPDDVGLRDGTAAREDLLTDVEGSIDGTPFRALGAIAWATPSGSIVAIELLAEDRACDDTWARLQPGALTLAIDAKAPVLRAKARFHPDLRDELPCPGPDRSFPATEIRVSLGPNATGPVVRGFVSAGAGARAHVAGTFAARVCTTVLHREE